MSSSSPYTFFLYGHAECGLCDRLERMIQPHLDRLRGRMGEDAVVLTKRDIRDDTELCRLYGERIPVLLCDGRVLLEGRPDQTTVDATFAGL